MAKKNKYRVTQTDNLLELAKKFQTSVSSLLQTNGIQSLTPGQTIQVPSRRGNPYTPAQPAPVQSNPFFNWMNQITGGSFGADAAPPRESPTRRTPTQTGGPKVMPSPTQFTAPNQPAPFMTEAMLPPPSQPPIGFNPQPNNPTMQVMGAVGNFLQNGFVNRPPAYGGSYNPTVQNSQSAPFMTQAMLPPQTAPFTTQSMLTPPIQPGYQDYGQRVNAGVTPTNALPNTQAAPLITPSSRAAGQAQFLSGNGLNPNSGYIPTRGDVWQMKVNARRRRMERNAGDVQQVTQQEMIAGNAQNTAVNWRV